MPTILTHPANRKLLRHQIGTGGIIGLGSYMIRCVDTMPERKIEELWHPESWGPFCELTEDDERWAKPLGLGRVEHVDRGPLFLILNYDFPSAMPAPPMSGLIYSTSS